MSDSVHDEPTRVDHQAALRDAYRSLLDSILTEPLMVQTFAEYMGVNRNKARQILDGMDGVQRVGGMVRVPIRLMPPTYHLHASELSVRIQQKNAAQDEHGRGGAHGERPGGVGPRSNQQARRRDETASKQSTCTR